VGVGVQRYKYQSASDSGIATSGLIYMHKYIYTEKKMNKHTYIHIYVYMYIHTRAEAKAGLRRGTTILRDVSAAAAAYISM